MQCFKDIEQELEFEIIKRGQGIPNRQETQT